MLRTSFQVRRTRTHLPSDDPSLAYDGSETLAENEMNITLSVGALLSLLAGILIMAPSRKREIAAS